MITGKNVRLRAIEREDIPRFVRWMNDPDVIENLLMNYPLSHAMEEKWFEKQVETPPTVSQILAIETLVGNDWLHIGNCGLHFIEPVNNAAEFGITIGEKEYWNKGLGREAAKLILKHGFENLNLNRIYLYVFATNPRAIKTYEAVGYKHEGTMRQGIYKNGRYIDVLMMSILHSEWNGM
jgi:RimJ/RimL family protein N-acetyltransferase